MAKDDIPTYHILTPPDAEFLTCGGSCAIFSYPDNSAEVAKVHSSDPASIRDLDIEKRIYARFEAAGYHPNIIRCLRIEDYGIHLERAEHGCIRAYFKAGGGATVDERIRWSQDLAEALQYVHDHKIRHGDISGRNVLLDSSRNIRLCDFAGSGIDGSKPTVWAESGFPHPHDHEARYSTIRAEIHALGSTIYEIMTSSQPHGSDTEQGLVASWIRSGKYPEVKDVVLGDIICRMQKTWKFLTHQNSKNAPLCGLRILRSR
ncbi:hypothetical protein PRK78_002718 [Emydomyces testavorans]|uniref:EKC/KEOPS complex subunit BUD32 n=1 Tax=Emydomyces testavorans TaxID=2070801 RepID=A0AAF0IHT7_9EURO|nr:hypothetical protein PRK78_002718 [Emydomyces testavorans]